MRRALSWPVRLALGFLFSVALWATLTAVAQAAGSAEQPVPPADAGTTTDTSQPPADDGGTPAENPADPAAPPADGTTAGTPEQAPPADDGSVPPQDVPPAGAETTPPPADGAPSEQPPSTDPNASGGNGQGVGCALPANSGEGSACPASSPNEPQSVPAQPSDSEPPDAAEPSPPVADPAPLPPAEPVSEPVAETPPVEPVAEPVAEPVSEAPVEPSADDAVVEEALEEDVVAETAGTCDASSVGVDLTTIVDLTAPALPCGDDLLAAVADDAADDPDVCGVLVPVISSGGTLDAIGTVPVSALSEAAATHADGPVPTPTVSAVSSNAHQPFHRQGPGAPAPMPAAPPAPAATGSGGACGGAGMRRDGIDRAGDQVAVLVRTDDLGVPTAAEQAATSAPADAVLARELDPRFRPD